MTRVDEDEVRREPDRRSRPLPHGFGGGRGCGLGYRRKRGGAQPIRIAFALARQGDDAASRDFAQAVRPAALLDCGYRSFIGRNQNRSDLGIEAFVAAAKLQHFAHGYHLYSYVGHTIEREWQRRCEHGLAVKRHSLEKFHSVTPFRGQFRRCREFCRSTPDAWTVDEVGRRLAFWLTLSAWQGGESDVADNGDDVRTRGDSKRDPVIVLIGASASGIQALQSFFDALPQRTGAAYIVVVHRDPAHRNEMPGVIAAHTTMPVVQIGEPQKLQADHVYVIPPDRRVQMVDHEIAALNFEEPRGERSPIDLLFRLVAERSDDGFAIILSGAGSDGALGVRAVKEAGGIVLVEDPHQAEYSSMPRSAISTGAADFVLPARELAQRLAELISLKIDAAGSDAAHEDEGLLQRVLAHHRRALEHVAPPSMLVDEAHRVVHLSENAGRFVMPSGGPLSGNAVDLVRPELRLELRSALNRAFEQTSPTLSPPVLVRFNGSRHRVHLMVKPAQDGRADPRAAVVMFIEGEEVDESGAGADQPLSDETVQRLTQELELTQARLRTVRQESDATNNELRTANQELQSINEEYRSTSEELETSREELQSINEELQTVNSELRLKLEAISRAHSDLQNLIAATDFGTLFLDSGLRIKRFTDRITELFSITPADEGRPITDFSHQLHYEDLANDVRAVLADLAPIRREVRSRSGRSYEVRIRPYRTMDDAIDGVVITFVDAFERPTVEDAPPLA
jgi:PAS domain-containing protein